MAKSQIDPRSIEELRAAYTAPTSTYNPAATTQAYITGSTLPDIIAQKSLDRQKAEEDLKKEIFALTEAKNKKAEEDKAAQLLAPVSPATSVSKEVPATVGNIADVNPDTNQVVQTPGEIQSSMEAQRGPALKAAAFKVAPEAIAPSVFGVQHGTPQIAVNLQTGEARPVTPDPTTGQYNVPQGWVLKDIGTAQIRADALGNQQSFVGVDTNGKPLSMNKKGQVSQLEVPGGGTILPKNATQQTAAVRDSAAYAKTIIPHIQTLRNLVDEADTKGYIGPVAGRVYGEFLAGKIGSTGNPDADKLLGQLRAEDSLMKSGTLKVHFGSRGGQSMYQHFSDILNSGKQSKETLNGALNGVQDFLQGYADAGNQNPLASSPAPEQTGGIHDLAKALGLKRKAGQ